MSKSRHVHHLCIVTIELKCAIHVRKKTLCSDNVVFQDDNRVVMVKDLRDALNDVALEIEIFGTFDEVEGSEEMLLCVALRKFVEIFA